MTRELRITTEPRQVGVNPVHVVRVAGYIDAHSFPRFEQEMQALIDRGGYRILVDLANATYICSTALGLLMSLVRQVRCHAGDLVVTGMSQKIANIFNLLGFAKLIRAFQTEEEGLRCLAGPEG